jgi:hypothetical protein
MSARPRNIALAVVAACCLVRVALALPGGQFLPVPSTLGETVNGNDAGTWETLAAGANGTYLCLVNGVEAWCGVDGGSFLTVPGTTTSPPSVAGGGWIYTNSTPHTTATDIIGGISFFVQASPGGLGYVRAGTSTSTMSVEVGVSFLSDNANTGVQEIAAGAYLYEVSTGKNLSFALDQLYTSSSMNGNLLLLVGSGVSTTRSYGNVPPFGKVFLRLRISGTNVLAEISVDKQVWATIFTTAITTAFTAAPSGSNLYDVGVYLPAATHPDTYVTLYDFVSN